MWLGRFYLEKNQMNAPLAIGVQLQISIPKHTYTYVFKIQDFKICYKLSKEYFYKCPGTANSCS